MNLFDKSFWTFVLTTGRVPRVAPGLRVADRSIPLGVKALSLVITSPGSDVVDPADIEAKQRANSLRSDLRVLNMPSLQGFALASDALSIPNAAIVPAQQAIASQLGGRDGF